MACIFSLKKSDQNQPNKTVDHGSCSNKTQPRIGGAPPCTKSQLIPLERRVQHYTTLRYLTDYNVIFMHCQSFNLLLELVLPSRHRGDRVQGQVRRLTLDTCLRPADIFLLHLYLFANYGFPPPSCGYFFLLYLHLFVDNGFPPPSCGYFFLLHLYLFVD